MPIPRHRMPRARKIGIGDDIGGLGRIGVDRGVGGTERTRLVRSIRGL